MEPIAIVAFVARARSGVLSAACPADVPRFGVRVTRLAFHTVYAIWSIEASVAPGASDPVAFVSRIALGAIEPIASVSRFAFAGNAVSCRPGGAVAQRLGVRVTRLAFYHLLTAAGAVEASEASHFNRPIRTVISSIAQSARRTIPNIPSGTNA